MDRNKQAAEKTPCAYVVSKSYVGQRNFSDVVIDLIFTAYGRHETKNQSKKTS